LSTKKPATIIAKIIHFLYMPASLFSRAGYPRKTQRFGPAEKELSHELAQ